MTILSATEITKAYGTDVILDKVSFHVNKGDHVGIIGANGAGKTTLLNILAGVDSADSGDFFVAKDTALGYLRQKDDFDPESTIEKEAEKIYGKFSLMEEEIDRLTRLVSNGTGTDRTVELSRLGDLQEKFSDMGGFSYKSHMRGILKSMAFSDDMMDRKIGTMSGGERTRLALACLLMERPDILLLDEPTNHLDIGMLKWLEQYMRSYKGTVILVSHDRYFLDQMTDRIFEIENHKLKTYEGNYTAFAGKKKAIREAELKAYTKQQEEIKAQEDLIRRYKERGTEKLAKRAASREKRLAHIDLLERPEVGPGKVKIDFRQDYKSGDDVLLGEGLSKSFGRGEEKKVLFTGAGFDIKRGQRICIVGPNGIGKTTLLKIMTGDLTPDEGRLRRGHQVKFGYYDQRQELLSQDKTAMDEIHDTYRLYKDSEIRALLGRFLFKGDRVFLKVRDLSGGERARLALLKLMLSGANVLVLDEPTNHLDIESKEVFEEALSEYPGTVIAVSHDRYFLNKVADKILELEAEGITEYLGGYDYYEEKKGELGSGKAYLSDIREKQNRKLVEGLEKAQMAAGVIAKDQEGRPLSPEEERAYKKKLQAEERRRARELDQLEKEIADLEETISETEDLMCTEEMLSDPIKLAELGDKLTADKEELEYLYARWEELSAV